MKRNKVQLDAMKSIKVQLDAMRRNRVQLDAMLGLRGPRCAPWSLSAHARVDDRNKAQQGATRRNKAARIAAED